LLLVLAGVARAAPPDENCAITPQTNECRCQAGDNAGCLAVSESLFGANQHDLAIVMALTVCEKDGEGCLRAALYMDKLHITTRMGKTSKQLRDRAISQFQDGCTANQGDACFRYGKLLVQGKLVPEDATRGLDLAEKGCTLKVGAACLFLGGIYGQDRGRKDEKRSLAFLEAACAAGMAAGCTAVGDRVTDKKRAAALFAKACEGEDALGCARSGAASRANPVVAVAAFEKACELDRLESCVDAAVLRTSGRGVVDVEKARGLYRSACDGDIGAGCVGLATMTAKGTGGPRNWGRAVELAQQACKLGTKGGCARATQLERSPPDGRCTTSEACSALCDEKIVKSCVKLAQLNGQPGDDESCDLAREAYARACEYGDGASCVVLGNRETEKRKASDWYRRGCKARAPEACILDSYIGAVDAAGREQLDATETLAVACAGNRGSACVWHALDIQDSDEKRAAALWRGACTRGQGRACRFLAATLERFRGTSVIALSGDVDSPTAAERRAEAERRRLLARGCALGDAPSCADAFESSPAGVAKRDARLKALAKAQPCGRAEIAWE
jgi:TPR repeat protein